MSAKFSLYGKIFSLEQNRNQICSWKLQSWIGQEVHLRQMTKDASKEEFVFVSVPTQPHDEKCGHAQNFQTQSVGELVLVSAWWCAWDGGWVRRRSRRHQLSAAVFTCTRELVVWCSGATACTSGRTRPVSSVPLTTACGLFAGICQWNCDQKSETVTKTLGPKWGQRVCPIWPTWPSAVTNNNQTTSGKKHDGQLQPASGCSGFMTAIQLQRVETLLYDQKMHQLFSSLYSPIWQIYLAIWTNTFCNLEFGQIHLAILTNISRNLSVWTNTFCNLDIT